jgi:hypothetical protein
MSLPLHINENSLSLSLRKVPMYALATEGEPNRSTTPQTAGPVQPTGIGIGSMR